MVSSVPYLMPVERAAARHHDAGARAAGSGCDPPVEEVAHLGVHLAERPRAAEVEHGVGVEEIGEQLAVGGTADRAPEVHRHGAVLVPFDELLDGGAQAVVDHRVALLVDQFGAVADGEAGEAVAGPVHLHGEVGAGGLGHLPGRSGPFLPGRAFLGGPGRWPARRV
jgi:hypothetical protein